MKIKPDTLNAVSMWVFLVPAISIAAMLLSTILSCVITTLGIALCVFICVYGLCDKDVTRQDKFYIFRRGFFILAMLGIIEYHLLFVVPHL